MKTTPQVRVNKNAYTTLQIGNLALRAIAAECIRTKTRLTRDEIGLGVDDIIMSISRMNRARGGMLSKSDIRNRIYLLAETWVG
jgi:hypothetical protein